DLAAEPLRDLREVDAFREQLADHTVARKLAGARGDEVAEPRQAGDRQGVRALGEPVTRDLREAARDETGFGVLAVAHAVDRARAERDDVLERSAQLDPDDVLVRVDAEHRRADDGLKVASGPGVDRRDHGWRR